MTMAHQMRGIVRSVHASLVLQNVKAQIFAFLERTCVMVIMTVEI